MKRLVKGVVVIISALLIMTLPACSSSSKSTASMATDGNTATSVKGSDNFGLADNAAQNATAEKTGAAKSTSTTSTTSVSANLSAAVSRKIVKSAEMSLTTTTYNKAVATVENTVESCGGFVQTASTQGEGASGNRTATYIVRVPTAQFNSFLDSVGKIGKVVSRNVKGEDITENYIDTETRLSALKTEQARIVDLLRQATKMSDILEIEQKLSDIETQIDQYTGELKKWDSLVDLSTVNINISEVSKGAVVESDTFSDKVAGIFTQSVSALVMTVKIICYVIVAILPFAVILGIVFAIIMLFRRRLKKYDVKKPVDERIVGSDDDKDDEGGNSKE